MRTTKLFSSAVSMWDDGIWLIRLTQEPESRHISSSSSIYCPPLPATRSLPSAVCILLMSSHSSVNARRYMFSLLCL